MATPILIGKKPNDTSYSGYTGRAYVSDTADVTGKYYDFGFVSGTIYLDNKGSETIYLSFKTVSDMDRPVSDEPTDIHAEISGGASRIFNFRSERYVKVFTQSSSSDFVLESW